MSIYDKSYAKIRSNKSLPDVSVLRSVTTVRVYEQTGNIFERAKELFFPNIDSEFYNAIEIEQEDLYYLENYVIIPVTIEYAIEPQENIYKVIQLDTAISDFQTLLEILDKNDELIENSLLRCYVKIVNYAEEKSNIAVSVIADGFIDEYKDLICTIVRRRKRK